MVCSNEGCKKIVTHKCYLALLVPGHKLKEQPGKLYCTKNCYVAGNKKDNAVPLAWVKDGKNGSDDPNNSMTLLIRWLVCPGNLAKLRGDCYNGGKSKSKISLEIAESINKQGVR